MTHDAKKSAEQCDQMVADHLTKAATSGKPAMQTLEDVEAVMKETTRICHDPANQSKP